MILQKVLDVNFHGKRNSDNSGRPLFIELSIPSTFLPVIVSSVKFDRYILVNKVSSGGTIRSGIFNYDPDRIDEILGPLFSFAFKTSEKLKLNNIFSSATKARNYIKKTSGDDLYPNIALIPNSMDEESLKKIFKNSLIPPSSGENRYFSLDKKCNLIHCNVSNIIFLSKPDYVGLLTQISGGMTSVLLHNLEKGFSFLKI